jgi:hypothetical protein
MNKTCLMHIYWDISDFWDLGLEEWKTILWVESKKASLFGTSGSQQDKWRTNKFQNYKKKLVETSFFFLDSYLGRNLGSTLKSLIFIWEGGVRQDGPAELRCSCLAPTLGKYGPWIPSNISENIPRLTYTHVYHLHVPYIHRYVGRTHPVGKNHFLVLGGGGGWMSFNSQLSLILSFSQLSPMRVMGLIECQVSLTKSVHVARGKKMFNKNQG